MQVHLAVAEKYHDIGFARLELRKLPAEQGEVRTWVSSNYSDTAQVTAVDLPMTGKYELFPDAGQTRALADWFERSGPWLALNRTNSLLRFVVDGKVDCPDENPEFMALIGTCFPGHPPTAALKVKVTRDDHPLCKGFRDFAIEYERFLTRRTADGDVLLHSSFTGICRRRPERSWSWHSPA